MSKFINSKEEFIEFLEELSENDKETLLGVKHDLEDQGYSDNADLVKVNKGRHLTPEELAHKDATGEVPRWFADELGYPSDYPLDQLKMFK